MGDYLLVGRPPADDAAQALSVALATEARANGYTVSDLNAHAWLAVTGPQPPRTVEVGHWTLIGEVFDRRAPRLPHTRRDDPFDYERKLVARLWGRFIGVRFGPANQMAALLRDPSGALDCVAWSQNGLTLCASSSPGWLMEALRPDWRINVERLALGLKDPLSTSGPLFLDGPVTVEPGTVQPVPLDQPAGAIWTPADIARRSLGAGQSTERSAADLAAAIDEAVMRLAGVSAPLAAEVSGGLDSSIVAASLVRGAPEAVRLWINAVGATPESDERVYVAALGRMLSFEALCVPHATAPMRATDIERTSQGFRPGLNALDRPHDEAWARRCQAAGVTTLMTGKGGDSILLQRASADVFTDHWRTRGWRTLLSADMRELAATNEVSVWTLVQQARRQHGKAYRPPRRDHPLFHALPDTALLHPWLRDLDAFGPAKRQQIAGVIDSVSRHGASLLTQAVDVRHPLCAQPVIEACLAIPTPVLTIGGRDRGLARLAFQDRLPVEISGRRSKGDMTSIYGRMILDNLDVLRPWLIEGRLVALGVLDRETVDQELTRETLIWRGRYSALIVAAAFEGWVRVWERRLAPSHRVPPGPPGSSSSSR